MSIVGKDGTVEVVKEWEAGQNEIDQDRCSVSPWTADPVTIADEENEEYFTLLSLNVDRCPEWTPDSETLAQAEEFFGPEDPEEIFFTILAYGF